MAFQDFDLINERRKSEKRAQMRKRIIIGVISSVVFVGLIGCAFFVATTKYNPFGGGGGGSHPEDSSTANGSKHVAHSEKVVKLVCSSADYKEKCEGPLNKAVEKDPKLQHPKDLLKVYLKTVEDEVNKAFNKTNSFKFNTKEEKAAFEDCKEMIQYAKDDLATSIDQLSEADMKKLASKTPDLNSWLSAVITFQETCVDGFPDGKLKTDLQKLFQGSREFVSNSLAIVSQVSTFLSSLQTMGAPRMLLSDNSPVASMDSEGIPSWIQSEERRVLKAADIRPKPNVVVAKDGSGNFRTISAALAAIPPNFLGRYVIYVKEGVYDEVVTITDKMKDITIYGDGSQKSIITGSKNFRDGVTTINTASFVVLGEGFLGLAMGFRNTAGPEGHQAVAARVQADRAVFANCRFEGFQDTLYTVAHRQFFRSCIITGTIDFIFGDAAVIFQNCILVVKKPSVGQSNAVTAQGRLDNKQNTAIVLHKCTIKADDALVPVKATVKSYLGRPWKQFSRTIVMESDIGDFISPEGWSPWNGNFALSTLYYAEYANTGPGASTTARVKWPTFKVINKAEASKWTVGTYLTGTWVQNSGVPSQLGLYK